MEQQNKDSDLEGYLIIDEAMAPLSSVISQMGNLDGFISDQQQGTSMNLAQVSIEMPVQLDISVGEDGQVTIGSSPPLYYTETTIMPVFHQLTLKIREETQQ